MNFEKLDEKMRRFEQSLDQVILPEMYLAARLDGRNFTRLTKETCPFEAPFDTRFRDAMVDTAKHLLECVKDYFSWRQEDAHRNSLNAHCYWMLRKKGISAREATGMIEGKSVSWKNELLFSEGVNYNELPGWQKRGIGLYRSVYERKGYNPESGQEELCTRSRIETEMELKTGEAYREWVVSLLREP